MSAIKDHEIRSGVYIDAMDDLIQHLTDLNMEDLAAVVDLVLKTYDTRVRILDGRAA